MNLQDLQHLLLWCTVINYSILLVWFAVFSLFHDRVYKVHSRWFGLTPERFDSLNYLGVAIYKIGIMLINLVPLIALTIVL